MYQWRNLRLQRIRPRLRHLLVILLVGVLVGIITLQFRLDDILDSFFHLCRVFQGVLVKWRGENFEAGGPNNHRNTSAEVVNASTFQGALHVDNEVLIRVDELLGDGDLMDGIKVVEAWWC